MQHTLNSSFSLSGKGLHTGLHLTATFHPAPEDHGYLIRRVDLEGMPTIRPLAENVIDTSRGTVVGTPDCRVSTIEHGMAALLANKKQLLNKSKSIIHLLKGYLKPNRRCFQVAFLPLTKG